MKRTKPFVVLVVLFSLVMLTACNTSARSRKNDEPFPFVSNQEPQYVIYSVGDQWYFRTLSDVRTFYNIEHDKPHAFQDVPEMYAVLSSGKLTNNALEELHIHHRDMYDTSPITREITNPNKLYYPIYPDNAVPSPIYWWGEDYSVLFSTPMGELWWEIEYDEGNLSFTGECQNPEAIKGATRSEYLPEQKAIATWFYDEDHTPADSLLMTYQFETNSGIMYIAAKYDVFDTCLTEEEIVASCTPILAYFQKYKGDVSMEAIIEVTNSDFTVEWLLGFDFEKYEPNED